MSRRPAVEPKEAKDWFRRYNEDGESPAQIAKAVGYDIRTVRKVINIEQEKKEAREAKLLVLRNALEQHYADLCHLASRLVTEISEEDGNLNKIKNSHLYTALREHLKRSVSWRELDRWEDIQNQMMQLKSSIETAAKGLIYSIPVAEFKSIPQELRPSGDRLIPLLLTCFPLTRGRINSINNSSFTLKEIDNELVGIEFQGNFIARIPKENKELVMAWAKRIINEIISSTQYREMQRLLGERDKSVKIMHDQLMVVVLKRIVPGHCQYCPI